MEAFKFYPEAWELMAVTVNKNTNEYRRMTESPVFGLVLRLSVPTTFSMLITSIYNLADTYVFCFLSRKFRDKRGRRRFLDSVYNSGGRIRIRHGLAEPDLAPAWGTKKGRGRPYCDIGISRVRSHGRAAYGARTYKRPDDNEFLRRD